jgi:EpsG family
VVVNVPFISLKKGNNSPLNSQTIFIFFIVWASLVTIHLHWQIDHWYKHSFGLNKAQDFHTRILSLDLSKDPAYFLVQAVFSGLGSFEVFFGILILICLALKFSALLQVTPRPELLDVAPYLLVLGFMHEGIQMRIAIALSVALWAIIFFAKGRRVSACLLVTLAALFHITAATFFLVFFLVYLQERLGVIVLIGAAILSGILAYTSVIPDILIKVGYITNARFMAYSQGTFFENQNKTGLFQYFIFFILFLTLYVWRYYKPHCMVWKNLKLLALTSGFVAAAILQIFRFNVVVSARLAELLLLPVLLVLGTTLVQLKNDKKYLTLSCIVAALVFYCAVRGVVSFNQTPLPF